MLFFFLSYPGVLMVVHTVVIVISLWHSHFPILSVLLSGWFFFPLGISTVIVWGYPLTWGLSNDLLQLVLQAMGLASNQRNQSSYSPQCVSTHTRVCACDNLWVLVCSVFECYSLRKVISYYLFRDWLLFLGVLWMLESQYVLLFLNILSCFPIPLCHTVNESLQHLLFQ